jgi:SSS family solute:Na+ symporter
MLLLLSTLVNIIAQLLAGIALITSVSPIGPFPASLLTALLMLAYVIFGGVRGTGFVGVAKLLLLYLSMITLGGLALYLGGGVGAFSAVLPSKQYFNLFARGVSTDLGVVFSLILGVVSTQTYVQAILSARNGRVAGQAALLSTLLIPPVGLAGVFIGMYMKIHYPAISPAAALPTFIMEKMPPLWPAWCSRRCWW